MMHKARWDGFHCMDCGYDLTGLESAFCPECGHELIPGGFNVGDTEQRAARHAYRHVLLNVSGLFL
ncbi:MAG: hypothetical protein ACF8NJ_03090, partial [Phycisphaerales bacterium JB038]